MRQAEWGIATGKRNFRKMVSLGPQTKTEFLRKFGEEIIKKIQWIVTDLILKLESLPKVSGHTRGNC